MFIILSQMGSWIPDLIEGDFKFILIIILHGWIKHMNKNNYG